MRIVKKILIDEKTGKKYHIKELDDDFHTPFGTVNKEYLKGNRKIVESSRKERFFLIEPTFPDLWESMKRGPQVMIQKDIGLILAKTGINSKCTAVDAGGGSGSLCLSLANVCKEIFVYETNPEHYDVITKNMKLFQIKNMTLKQENVYKGISEKDVYLITLDLPEPWNVTKHAESALKSGGYLVVYLPNISQVKLFIDSTKSSSIKVTETIELLERKWKIEERIMRPEFDMLGHTGFLTFCRKY